MSQLSAGSQPKLRPGCRLSQSAQQGDVLLIPEGVLRLVGPGRKIVESCDGQRTVEDIIRELKAEFPSVEPERIARFAERFGTRGILQCRGLEHFPDDAHVDWLFDRSGGKGRLPEQWPVPEPSAAFVGYSGGLGPETVADALATITRQHPETVQFWIDMEGAIRTDDLFDVSKCLRVCEIVYG